MAYLLLIQQQKRLAYSRAVGLFYTPLIVFFPVLIVITIIRWIDLKSTNEIIGSLINEHHLLLAQRSDLETP